MTRAPGKRFYTFAAAFACVFATFQLAMETSRSADTWVYGVTTARLPLNHSGTGRPLSALFQYLYNFTGWNIVHQQAMFALLSIGILATAVAWLYLSTAGNHSLVRFLACFAIVCNPFLIEFFTNIEITALYCLAQLLAIVAGVQLSDAVLTRRRVILSLILTVAVFALYPPPAALILGIALVRSPRGSAVRRLLIGISCWLAGAAVCWAWVRFVHPLFGFRVDPRTHPPNIAANLHSLLLGQKDLWIDSFALMPPYVFAAFVLAGIALFVSVPAPRQIRIASLTAIAVLVALSLAPHLFAGGVWLVGRSVTAIGSIPGLLLLSCLPFVRTRSPRYWAALAFAAVFSIVILAQNNRLLADNLTTYGEDAEEARLIADEIGRQETLQGSVADKIAFAADRDPVWCYPGIRCDGDMNTRAWVKQYACPYILLEVTGRKFTVVPFGGDFKPIFGAEHWDRYSPQQVHVIGKTAYVAIY